MGKKSKRKSNEVKGSNSYFFAYQSKEKSFNGDNADAINQAVKVLNASASSWEKMKSNGRLLNKKILEEIDRTKTFVCDLTYLNSNVYFELGYAVGKRKRIIILINNNIKDAKKNYNESIILKSLGYSNFQNSDDIIKVLEEPSGQDVLLDQIKRMNCEESNTVDVFYIKTSKNSQAELDCIAELKNGEYNQICDDYSEMPYEPLEWYFEAINKSKCLVVHLSNDGYINVQIDNTKNSFFAGLGHALGKKVFFMAPKPYNAPIDYAELLFEYDSADECVDKIKKWVHTQTNLKETKPKKIVIDKELNLLKLGIGYSIAEDEKNALLNYFVPTYAYNEAKKARSSIFYGRKGTGKTALYIKLVDDFSNEENTFLVAIKPESIELIENIQTIKLWDNIANKKNLFHTVWKYVIYSKLTLEIFEILSEKNKLQYTNEEENIINYVKENEEYLGFNFIGSLNKIVEDVKKTGEKIDSIISKYNKEIIAPLTVLCKDYFDKNKYAKIAIIADNLDKAWEVDSDLTLQTEMILSLLEITGKIQQEINIKSKSQVDAAVVIFLRTDIYEFVIRAAREPDKLTISSHEVDWTKSEGLLKELVEKRISYVLEMDSEANIHGVWNEYFDVDLQKPMELVCNTCILRPRDIIFFFGKMFESTCNNSRKKVDLNDYNNALSKYSNFLYQNLIAEMEAEYPFIRAMIEKFHDKFNDKIDLKKFKSLIVEYTNNISHVEKIIEDLFENEYIIALNSGTTEKIIKYEEMVKVEKEEGKKLGFFVKKNEIYIIQHPRYARKSFENNN